jgi:hypothetical protein
MINKVIAACGALKTVFVALSPLSTYDAAKHL